MPNAAASAETQPKYGYGWWLVRNRWAVVAGAIVMFLIAASGGRFLAMNPAARVFFSEDNPHLLALEQLENTYSKVENLLFVLVPRDGEVFTRDTLEGIEWLTEESWQTHYSTRVDSISNYQNTRSEMDDFCLLYTYTSPRDAKQCRMPSSP